MKELVLTLLILVIVFVLFAIIAFIMCKIMFFWIDKNNREFEEKHPDYIKFKNKYNELLQESMNIWNSTMPDKRKEVDKCIEEMKYYPESSEWYEYYKAKLDVAKMRISECKGKYEEKKVEIYEFVKANKAIIESIKDERLDEYQNFINMFDLENI